MAMIVMAVIWLDVDGCQHLFLSGIGDGMICLNCGADLSPRCRSCGQSAIEGLGLCKGCYEKPDNYTMEDAV